MRRPRFVLWRIWLCRATTSLDRGKRCATPRVPNRPRAEAAHAALDDLSGEVASWYVGSELAAVAQRLAAYPEVEGVESFLTRYQIVS